MPTESSLDRIRSAAAASGWTVTETEGQHVASIPNSRWPHDSNQELIPTVAVRLTGHKDRWDGRGKENATLVFRADTGAYLAAHSTAEGFGHPVSFKRVLAYVETATAEATTEVAARQQAEEIARREAKATAAAQRHREAEVALRQARAGAYAALRATLLLDEDAAQAVITLAEDLEHNPLLGLINAHLDERRAHQEAVETAQRLTDLLTQS